MNRVNEPISSAFPYAYHFVDVLDSDMAYVDEGEGETFLFIHGVPASSYCWRNVMAPLKNQARCIAVDLIGFGKSGKPDIAYTTEDHIRYLIAFIEKLQLKEITLVMHAFGGVIGLSVAMEHPEWMKRLVFFETQIRPVESWEHIALPVQQWASSLRQIPDAQQKIASSTFYIDQIFPSGVMRRLTEEEMRHYREPFLLENSRKPILVWLKELPFASGNSDAGLTIGAYSKALQRSSLPKLLLYAEPGFSMTMETVAWAKTHLPHLSVAFIGEDLHFPQETQPALIAQAITEWIGRL